MNLQEESFDDIKRMICLKKHFNSTEVWIPNFKMNEQIILSLRREGYSVEILVHPEYNISLWNVSW